MITQIDHIIVSVEKGRLPDLSARLKQAGFVHGDSGRHPGGTANETLAFEGGAFIELLYEQSIGSGPAIWFRETPRVQGVGFSTTDYSADIAAWISLSTAWNRTFHKVFEDGREMSSRAAGPLPMEEFYVFCMDRAAPPFHDRGASAKLQRITFAGMERELWHRRFRDWFGLREDRDTLMCGDVELRFQDGPHPSIRASLRFVVPEGGGTIPISGGVIELVEESPSPPLRGKTEQHQ